MAREKEVEQEIATPQHELRKKLAAEKKQAEPKVVEEWYERRARATGMPKSGAKRSGMKVILIQRLDNGNKHSTFIGFESECGDVLAKARKAGKLR